MKKSSITFILWLAGLVGICGLHRFYVGRPVTGLIWLFTLGLVGFGQLFDLFFLGSMVRQANMLNGLYRGGGNTVNNAVAPVFNIAVNVPGSQPAASSPAVALPSTGSVPMIEAQTH